MELGNSLVVSRDWESYAAQIVKLIFHNCITMCKRYGIEPVGSFEMRTELEPIASTEYWITRYHFVSDED